jgi:hypothetical protein
MENQTASFVEQNFNVNVDDVLIRPKICILSTAPCGSIPKSNFGRSPQDINKNKRCCIRKVWNRRNDGYSLR